MKKQKQQGFTIIEVVLVLAIAGLIFLMVFIALPALQRSQRDTQRKNDLSRFMSQINQYQANSKGDTPTGGASGNVSSFVTSYLKANQDTFKDPNGNDYIIDAFNSSSLPAVGHIQYGQNATCGTGGLLASASGSRKVAASIGLEAGGAYCQSN